MEFFCHSRASPLEDEKGGIILKGKNVGVRGRATSSCPYGMQEQEREDDSSYK